MFYFFIRAIGVSASLGYSDHSKVFILDSDLILKLNI